MTKSKPGTDQLGPLTGPLEPSEETLSFTSFEAAMGELESIVRSLEHGGESLEKALEDYSNAIGLLKVCHRTLEKAERRVEILSGVDTNGNPVTEPVDEIQESMEEKRLSRSSKRMVGKKQLGKSEKDQPIKKSIKEPENPGLF